MGALDDLAGVLRADGGLLADAVAGQHASDAELGVRAAAGARTQHAPDEYALLVEAIREGELCHYERGRVISTDDADLALLAGDRLYALGLERLAELGDLDAVVALADVITAVAQANAEGSPADTRQAWDAGLERVTG